MGKKKDKASTIAQAAAVGAAKGLVKGDPKEALQGAAIGAGVALMALVTEAVRDHRARRTQALLDGLVLGAESPEKAAARVREAILDPKVAPAVIEAAKAMDSVVDERVIPAIAALTRAYALGEKPIDRFFRGALRLLSESTAEELVPIAAFAEVTIRFPGDDREVLFMPHFDNEPARPVFQVNEPERYSHAMFVRIPGGRETPAALEHHRLARPRSYNERGRATFAIQRSDARALYSYIKAAGIDLVEAEVLN